MSSALSVGGVMAGGWHVPGITRSRRHRWPVEVYHEEGKDEGLDQYQLRDFGAIEQANATWTSSP